MYLRWTGFISGLISYYLVISRRTRKPRLHWFKMLLRDDSVWFNTQELWWIALCSSRGHNDSRRLSPTYFKQIVSYLTKQQLYWFVSEPTSMKIQFLDWECCQGQGGAHWIWLRVKLLVVRRFLAQLPDLLLCRIWKSLRSVQEFGATGRKKNPPWT